jgi:hypothetical protein
MAAKQTPPVLAFLPTALLFSLIGWGGIAWLFLNTLPTVGPRWLFFFFWFLALTGIALPVMAFLNRRFPGHAPATPEIITRQAMWVGFYGCLIAWLQIGRVVTPALVLLLAVGFAVVEMLLRLRERSQWKP